MATRGPERTVTNDDLIDAVQEAIETSGAPVASTTQISDLTDISGTRVRELTSRVDEIESKKIGGGGPRVYWLRD